MRMEERGRSDENVRKLELEVFLVAYLSKTTTTLALAETSGSIKVL